MTDTIIFEPREPRILLDEMSNENKIKMARRKPKGRKPRRKVKINVYPKSRE
jgi:hypothetical protein